MEKRFTPKWVKYTFKDGNEYELSEVGKDGVLVFRDIAFRAPFDDKPWRDATNDYELSTLKPLLEKWWEDNAPDELKAKYSVSIPHMVDVFDQKSIDEFYEGSGKKPPKAKTWPIFKDWHERIKGYRGEQCSRWWWLRAPNPWDSHHAAAVHTDGSLHDYDVLYAYGCVPACHPLNLSNSPEPGAARDGSKGR